MLSDKKDIFILFLGLIILFFTYFSYQQNVTIAVMNEEITRQADHVQKAILERYAVDKKLDSVTTVLKKVGERRGMKDSAKTQSLVE